MRRTLQILMILIVALTSGSHLAVLQAVAWTGMLVGNAQEYQLGDALSRTFGGDHPCGLCDAIAKASDGGAGAAGNRVPPPSAHELDLKLVPIDRLVLLPPVPGRLARHMADWICSAIASRPLVPPPQLA